MSNLGKFLYRWWMKFAHVLAVVNTTVLLSLVYFFLIGPFSLVVRLFEGDLMKHRLGSSKSFWVPKEEVLHTPEQSSHQF